VRAALVFLPNVTYKPLAYRLLFAGDRARTAGRALHAIPQKPYIDLEFVDGAAERVAVHTQFARGAALIAFVFLEHGEDKTLLELTHALGVENIALVHLQDKRFQLIFHDRFLSRRISF